MTGEQLANLENEVFQAALSAEKAVAACRLRLSIIGQHLETIGRALQEHPEEVTPLPEPISPHDYRTEINALRDGEKAIQLCNELRVLRERAKQAEARRAMLANGPFFSRD